MHNRLALVVLTSCLAACPSPVIEEFEAARASALAPLGPIPADWVPDAILTLSEDQLDALVAEGLRRGGAMQDEVPISGPLGVKGTIQPDLLVEDLDLGPSKACPGCMAIDTRIAGEVTWTLGPARGVFPVSASIALDTELSAIEGADAWEVLARPHEVRSVDVEIGNAGKQIRSLAEGLLQGWIKEALEARNEPVVITRIERAELPVRALRVSPRGAGLRVDMLTSAGVPASAKPMSAMPDSGWRLEIARESLLAIVRRTSFEAGPVSHDVVIEPTGISLTSKTFALDLRLWRIKGRGWWRDYHAEGDVVVEGSKIELTPTTVEALGSSPGAVLSDPLAAIARGAILDAVEESLSTSMPGVHRSDAGDRTAEVRIAEIDGTGAMLRVLGSLDFKAPRKPKPKPAPKK